MGSGKGQARRVQAVASGFAVGNAFKQKYHEAIKYLDENFAYFLTHVLNIGEPSQNNSIPTACVALPTKSTRLEDFKFLFSPDFAATLSDADMGFVLAHETMHILLNHLKIVGDFDNPQLFNLAADAVINDYLADIGLAVPEMGVENPLTGKKEGGLITGEGLVGHNCMNSTVTDVYNELKHMQQEQEQQQGEGQGEGESGEGDGEPGEGGGGDGDGKPSGYGSMGDGFGAIDDHTWMHEPAQGSQERKDQEDASDRIVKGVDGQGDMPQDLKDKSRAEGQTNVYSFSGEGEERRFVEDQGVKLNWIKLLKKIEPDIIKKRGLFDSEGETWSRPNRKTAAYHPDILLPGVRDDEPTRKQKESIVLALDMSMSIGPNDANNFLNLARSIPRDKVNVYACTFNSTYHVLDIDAPKLKQNYGTNFCAIDEFVREKVMPENRGRYPKAVVVITDGEEVGPSLEQQLPKKDGESWHWLLTDDSPSHHAQRGPAVVVGKHYPLKEFV